MKNCLIFIPLFSCFISLSQPDLSLVFPISEGKIVYSEIVQVDSSLTADVLYKNAKVWIVSAFNSAKDVIQTESQSDHLLVAKGFNKRSHHSIIDGKLWFTFKLETKDGRYRYFIYDIIYEYSGSLMGATVHETIPYENWANSDAIKKASSKQQEKIIAFSKIINDDFVTLIESMKANITKSQDW